MFRATGIPGLRSGVSSGEVYYRFPSAQESFDRTNYAMQGGK